MTKQAMTAEEILKVQTEASRKYWADPAHRAEASTRANSYWTEERKTEASDRWTLEERQEARERAAEYWTPQRKAMAGITGILRVLTPDNTKLERKLVRRMIAYVAEYGEPTEVADEFVKREIQW